MGVDVEHFGLGPKVSYSEFRRQGGDMETGFLAEKFRVASRPKKSEQPMAPALVEIDLSHIVFPQRSVNGLKAISLQNDNSGIFLVEDMK